MKIISIARDFSTTPGARFAADGPFSGEEFREKFLTPCFNEGEKIKGPFVLIYLDGTEGYASCFLDEAFGGLARRFGKDVSRGIVLVSAEDLLITEINEYMNVEDHKEDTTALSRSEKIQRSKSKKKEWEEEQRIKGNIESELARLRDQTINPPTVFYKVGERVQRGNINHSVVTEVLDGGKILKIVDYVTDELDKRPGLHFREGYVAWHQLQPYRSEEELKKIKIFHKKATRELYFLTVQLGQALSFYYDRTNMNPHYQRGNVWSEKDKEALIDSIMSSSDIGKFVFIRLPYEKDQKHRYEILDGKQRITTLVDFFEGRFLYKGVSYFDMHPGDQYHLRDCIISLAVAEDLTEKDIYEYFVRLNSTGVAQDKDHIEKVKGMITDKFGKKD